LAFKQPQPPTQSFDVVGLEDSALDAVPEPLKELYRSERKIEILDEPDETLKWAGLSKLDEKPTRCTCLPLRGGFLPLIGPSMDAADMWKIFAAHCTKIINLLDDKGNPIDPSEIATWWEGEDEKRKIKTAVFLENKIPYRLWVDIAGTIIHKGTSGQDTPFILPRATLGITQEAREHQSRAKQILTYARSKKSAMTTSSKSSDQTTTPPDDSPAPTGEA
jgi:hypothetical protein